MSRQLLIDALVRQCMVMIARLATTHGVRSPLAHMAHQVFLDITEELRARGLGHKVIADMFGLTLRAYHAKVRRLNEDSIRLERTLWQDVVDHLEQASTLSRVQLLKLLKHEDSAGVVGILNDMVCSGWVFCSGEGDQMRYRLVRPDDVSPGGHDFKTLCNLVWMWVHRNRRISFRGLLEHLPNCDPAEVDKAVFALEEQGHIERICEDAEVYFGATQMEIGMDDYSGGVAAMVDHFQAVANTICARFERAEGIGGSRPEGGSTYHFDVHDSHPLRDEVMTQLSQVSKQLSDLRRRVTEINHQQPATNGYRVVFYAGQHVQSDDEGLVATRKAHDDRS